LGRGKRCQTQKHKPDIQESHNTSPQILPSCCKQPWVLKKSL
jgi:hypothetical protein